ncbi:MAG: OmpA family protein [Bacteroidia bacterium]|nr:OmpA family protein [Bacteroidia bacterium]
MRSVVLLSFFLMFATLLRAQQYSGRFELVKMGTQVNTHYHEAAPIISPDGNTLYFFVDNHPDNTYGKDASQDIWTSKKDDKGEWSPAQHLGAPFNDHRSNQVFTVFDDGTLFIKGGRSKNEKGFSLVSSGGGLVELSVKTFDKMNKGRFYGASMSADKKHIVMYFSERDNSALSDLYISHAQGDGSYSVPAKLKLSHSLDDFAPFIAPDQKAMYYASARPGEGRQGGIDIYKTTRKDDTWENWSEPVNLGRPINTAAMDAYFSVDKNGNVFVSRSNSRVDGGNLDLFVLVPKELKLMLSGVVFDDKTKEIIPAATVGIKLNDKDPLSLTSDANGKFESQIPETNGYTIDVTASGYQAKSVTGKIPALERDTALLVDIYLVPVPKKLILAGDVYNQKTDQLMTARLSIALKGDKATGVNVTATGGKYERGIEKLGWYMITASAEGFLNATDSVWINSKDVTPVIKDMYLQPIEVGVTVRLKNIYFDFDKTTLKSESFVELNKVVEFLKQNPSVEIEISGHTDSKGSDEYNVSLSQGRSEAVVSYLASQGIDSYRLTAQGYGEGKPIDSNDTDAGRANNRRVEFTILKK